MRELATSQLLCGCGISSSAFHVDGCGICSVAFHRSDAFDNHSQRRCTNCSSSSCHLIWSKARVIQPLPSSWVASSHPSSLLLLFVVRVVSSHRHIVSLVVHGDDVLCLQGLELDPKSELCMPICSCSLGQCVTPISIFCVFDAKLL